MSPTALKCSVVAFALMSQTIILAEARYPAFSSNEETVKYQNTWTKFCCSLSLEKARILQGDSNWPKREGRGGKENVRFFVRWLHKIVGLCKRVFLHCSVFHFQRGYVPKPALRVKRSNVRLYTLASKCFFTARDNTALQKHREPQRHLLHIDRVQRKIRDLSRKLRLRVNYSIF